MPAPPFAIVHDGEADKPVNQLTTVVPTVDVMAIWALLENPTPVMVRDDPTVPEVTPVTSVGPPAVVAMLVIVDRVTVGLAAWAGEAGSKKTIPAIPARKSSPIVPNEASLLFGVICICILFTIFVTYDLGFTLYNACGQMVYSELEARSIFPKRARTGFVPKKGTFSGHFLAQVQNQWRKSRFRFYFRRFPSTGLHGVWLGPAHLPIQLDDRGGRSGRNPVKETTNG